MSDETVEAWVDVDPELMRFAFEMMHELPIETVTATLEPLRHILNEEVSTAISDLTDSDHDRGSMDPMAMLTMLSGGFITGVLYGQLSSIPALADAFREMTTNADS